MTKTFLPLFLLSVISLTGCVDRDQADAMLQKGCVAGVNALLPDEGKIDKIVDAGFQSSTMGPDFRRVNLTATIKDDWLEAQNSYECVFQESFGFMNAKFTGALFRIRVGETTYGKDDEGKIQGETQEFIRLTEEVGKAMYGE